MRSCITDYIFASAYNTLSINEQAKFRALSVFKESFDIKAAITIWQVEASKAEIFLARLVSLSFLNSNDDLYAMHPLTRAFVERLMQNASQEERDNVQEAYSNYLNELSVDTALL